MAWINGCPQDVREKIRETTRARRKYFSDCAKKGWDTAGHKEQVLSSLSKFWTKARRKERAEEFKKTPKKFISKGFVGHKHTEAIRKKLREYGLKGRRIAGTLKPNKAEKKLASILPKSFRFVGDGSVEIAGKNPDFLNEKDKKIVELYGDFWHSKRIEEDKIRIRDLESEGYKVLVIWEHELKEMQSLKKKLEAFA